MFIKILKQSAEEIVKYETDGYAIGGLSVGEPHDLMYEMTDDSY